MDWHNALQAIRQFSLPRTRALREELGAVRAEHAAVSAELEAVRDEFTQAHAADTQQISVLQLQLSHLESDRENARQQTQLLEESLRQANQRQAGTEKRMASLETQLEEARNQHESNLYLTRDALKRMQSEQHSLLSLQSDMAQTFHEVSHELLQTLQAQARPRLSVLQMSFVASLLFLSGALATALVLQDSRDGRIDLSELSDGISDLQVLMRTHFRTHDELMGAVTRLIELNTTGRRLPEPGTQTPGDDAVSGELLPGTSATGTGEPAAVEGRRRDSLEVLGFMSGDRLTGIAKDGDVERALQRFRQLYRLEGRPDDEVDTALRKHAAMARADARKYGIDSDIVAAIRLASLRTGVEFSYLMELAGAESSFDPQARAATSSASGLFQFKDESWLDAVRSYGHEYGLAYYAAQIEQRQDDEEGVLPYIADQEVQQRVLDLRFNPQLAALMTAEHVRSNRTRLATTLDRQPGRTELYLTHFFGTSGAISFLKALAETPDRIAGEVFPGPARRNRSIFQTRDRVPRTVAEVYKVLSSKFNTTRYDES